MTTKSGLTALIGGSYVMAFGIAGLSYVGSGWLKWLYGLVFIIGFCLAGWSCVLPWDAQRRP